MPEPGLTELVTPHTGAEPKDMERDQQIAHCFEQRGEKLIVWAAPFCRGWIISADRRSAVEAALRFRVFLFNALLGAVAACWIAGRIMLPDPRMLDVTVFLAAAAVATLGIVLPVSPVAGAPRTADRRSLIDQWIAEAQSGLATNSAKVLPWLVGLLTLSLTAILINPDRAEFPVLSIVVWVFQVVRATVIVAVRRSAAFV